MMQKDSGQRARRKRGAGPMHLGLMVPKSRDLPALPCTSDQVARTVMHSVR